VLDGHEDRPAPLAADPDALAETQHDEQDGGHKPDGIEGRQKPDQGRRDAHDEEREYEHGLAADPVPEVAEYQPAYRPRHEADRVGRRGSEPAGCLTELRKKERGKDERRRRTVEEEVVPLDGSTDKACHRHLAY